MNIFIVEKKMYYGFHLYSFTRGFTSIHNRFFFKKGNQIVKYFAKTDVPRDPFVHSLTVSHVFRGSRPFANSFTMEGAISSHWKKKQQQRTKYDKSKSDPPLHLSTF